LRISRVPRDEPVVWLAGWEGGEARLTREVSGVLEPLVVPALKDTNFLCRRARRPVEPVLHTSEGRVCTLARNAAASGLRAALRSGRRALGEGRRDAAVGAASHVGLV